METWMFSLVFRLIDKRLAVKCGVFEVEVTMPMSGHKSGGFCEIARYWSYAENNLVIYTITMLVEFC